MGGIIMFKNNVIFSVLLIFSLFIIAAKTEMNSCARATGMKNNQQKNSCQIPLTENWQIETWEDTKGLTNVEFDSVHKHLILFANLEGKHKNLSKGEIFLDLRWVSLPCIDTLRQQNKDSFVNLSGKTLIVTLEIPKGFIGPKSAPNGIQLFAKSGDDFDAAYSTWQNVEKSGEITVKFNLSKGPYGFKKPNYSAKNIASIGVKLAINSSSYFKFNGRLCLKNILVE